MNMKKSYFLFTMIVFSRNDYGATPQPSTAVFRPKIVGGSAAKSLEYPFMVSLQYKKLHFCGGSIVTMRFGVTATHCFKVARMERAMVTALVGVNDLRDGGQRHEIERIIEHDDYSEISYKNDIAVFYVNPVFLHTNSVVPVRLRNSDIWAGEDCKIAGWGLIKHEDKEASKILLTADVTIIEQKKCSLSYKVIKPVSMVCAYNYGKDSCQGDSGGPMMCKGLLTGIVSHGKGCGSDYPGVYTNVYHFRDWILRGAGTTLKGCHLFKTLLFILLSRSCSYFLS